VDVQLSSFQHFQKFGIYIAFSTIFGIGELICNILVLAMVDFYSESIFYAIMALMIIEAVALYYYCFFRLMLNKREEIVNPAVGGADLLCCIYILSFIPIEPMICVTYFHDIDGLVILILSPVIGLARLLTLFHNKLRKGNENIHKYLFMQNLSITNGIFSFCYCIIYIIVFVKAQNNYNKVLMSLALSFSSICFIYYVILMLLKLNGEFIDAQQQNNGGV
jgi:hypothetical protein